MKNISRRVFIKGLAVAGVAAAASTVLAGCNTNMIPGTNDEGETEVVPTPSNTYTFKDGDNTLTIEAPKFLADSFSANSVGKEKLVFALNIDNAMGKTVKLVTAHTGNLSTSVTAASVFVGAVVTCKVYDKNNDPTSVSLEDTNSLGNYKNLLVTANQSIAEGSTSGYVYTSDTVDDTWKKAVVTVEVYTPYATASGSKYYFKADGKADGKTEFVFENK